jgi:TetR/AcrR family transcriptional regulator, cholesterol catabolism regulator
MAAERGPQRRSRVRYERKREEVVAAAARVFAERGFEATTVDDLMEATGLQRGGLYHYMTNKSELLAEIHRRLLEPLLAEVERIEVEPHDPSTTVRLIAHALAHNLRDYNNEMVVFLHEWRTIRDEPAWEDIRRGRRDLEHVIERALRRGVMAGDFDIPDTRLAVLGLLGMFNHAHQWFKADGRVTADELADCFADIFLRGVEVPAAR